MALSLNIAVSCVNKHATCRRPITMWLMYVLDAIEGRSALKHRYHAIIGKLAPHNHAMCECCLFLWLYIGFLSCLKPKCSAIV